MNAPATRKPVVTADIFGNQLTLNFITGEELQIDITKLDPEIIKQATLHGLKQKLCDAAAIARNTTTGNSASPIDKYNAVRTVYDRLMSTAPTWNAVREGVERAPNSIFVRAVAEVTGKSVIDTAAQLKAMTKEQQASLKKNIRIIDAMQRLELAEAQNAGSTGDDLLSMLMGGNGTAEPTDDHVELSDDNVELTETKPARARRAPKA